MKRSSRFWWLSLQSELIDDLIETGVSSIEPSFFINFWNDWKSAKSPFCDVSSSSDSDDSPDDDFNGFELYLVPKIQTLEILHDLENRENLGDQALNKKDLTVIHWYQRIDLIPVTNLMMTKKLKLFSSHVIERFMMNEPTCAELEPSAGVRSKFKYIRRFDSIEFSSRFGSS